MSDEGLVLPLSASVAFRFYSLGVTNMHDLQVSVVVSATQLTHVLHSLQHFPALKEQFHRRNTRLSRRVVCRRWVTLTYTSRPLFILALDPGFCPCGFHPGLSLGRLFLLRGRVEVELVLHTLTHCPKLLESVFPLPLTSLFVPIP